MADLSDQFLPASILRNTISYRLIRLVMSAVVEFRLEKSPHSRIHHSFIREVTEMWKFSRIQAIN
jgi:hypothetical protein